MRSILLLAATCLATPAFAQSAGGEARPGPEYRMEGHVNKFAQLPPAPERLRVPQGYAVAVAARDLGNARMLAVHDNGTVYVTRRTEGDVQMLRDTDGDGIYETRRMVASRPDMHGIAIDGDMAYLVTIKTVYEAPIRADGSFGELSILADDLPDAGQHPNRTIAVGPDKALYISAGSTCNACAENNPENATILRMSRDGKDRTIFASGLRNTIGFDWHPSTGQLWGLDHGIDWLGDDVQPEELNRIRAGGIFGWPYIWGDGGENPQDEPPGGLTKADWKKMSTPMVLGHTAHAAPMQMAFNKGVMFPAATQGDAFAAFRGSWNRAEPSGYEVVRIRFGRDGEAQAIEPFVTGWLQPAPDGGQGWTGRPTGLAFAPDGAMLVTDPENGVLYRVTYAGEGATRAIAEVIVSVEEPNRLLASDWFPDMRERVAIRSSAFDMNGAMPQQFSAYHDDINPPLSWAAGPAGTQSYAILVDDPDARPDGPPASHWVAFNIPAGTTQLREGLPGAPQLTDPQGMRQGINDRGSHGWYGPRPPIGDTPHRYHFQIFALDTMLDLLPDANRFQLLDAMEGHVLAKGQLSGTYSQQQVPRE